MVNLFTGAELRRGHIVLGAATTHPLEPAQPPPPRSPPEAQASCAQHPQALQRITAAFRRLLSITSGFQQDHPGTALSANYESWCGHGGIAV